jgi:hypothetical protein
MRCSPLPLTGKAATRSTPSFSACVTEGFDTPDLKEAKALLDNLR